MPCLPRPRSHPHTLIHTLIHTRSKFYKFFTRTQFQSRSGKAINFQHDL